ncbi:hypothetical protein OSB04_003974 [Centaurea solstitialis]|uniref:Thioredoxin domain-containing protein n=1 Tax=Centaurea solstitialis TaxID=347529 RepID=A0AA38U3E2_9ASTR|nr:hypothetical protein OSB04_003974 [Centaurea solstitialis]
MQFPALSCEFASLDVSDILGTNRLNITKTVHKYPINKHLEATGSEYDRPSGPTIIKHDDKVDEETSLGSVALNAHNFDKISHQYPILVVNFFAPWCIWSKRLKPSWERAARIIRERSKLLPNAYVSQEQILFCELCTFFLVLSFIPYFVCITRHNRLGDGSILLGKVDCTEEIELCRSHHIQGYPSIRIFRKGSDVWDVHGHHEHESYYGDRDTDSLVEAMEQLVKPIELEQKNRLQRMEMARPLLMQKDLHHVEEDVESKGLYESRRENDPDMMISYPLPTCIYEFTSFANTVFIGTSLPPKASGKLLERPTSRPYLCLQLLFEVPGNLVISARSESHSFDASLMNMSHIISNFSFGRKVTPRMIHDLERLNHYKTHDKLSGKAYITVEDHAILTIEHYIQVVKFEVASPSHQLIEDYEYTAHSSLVYAQMIPVALFHFEPSPMQILVMEHEKTFRIS